MNIYLLLIFITTILGNKLYNIPVILSQPDGTNINCYTSGDEYYHWLHDKKNYTITQKDDGYYYYATISNNNKIIASNYKVVDNNPVNLDLIPNVKISKIEYQKIRNEYWDDIETRDAPSVGTLNNLNVFIRFADEDEFITPRSFHDQYFNDINGPSMYHYFNEVSYGLLTVNTSHYPECDLTTNLSYQDQFTRDYYKPYNETSNPIGYSNHDEAGYREHTLLKNAIEFIADEVPSELDIDLNNDGYIDNVTFLVNGSPGAWADLLWPHRWSLYSYDVYINGSRVYDYNLNLDQGGYFTVGTLCHEFFHSLGAPDLYHYYDEVSPTAVGGWDVMDASADIPQSMSAYMKYRYTDWITMLPQIDIGGTYSLNPLSSNDNNIYRINSPLSDNEYFVLEYRVKEGLYEINTPGDVNGILIYRINTDYNGNANGPPDGVYLYRYGGTLNASGSFGAAIFSQETLRNQFNDMTNPSCFLTDGSSGGINISYIGDDLDTIDFTVTNLILVTEINELIYDTDEDGNINPGEEIILDFTVSNYSDGIYALDIQGNLSSDDNIIINNPEVLFTDILFPGTSGNSASASFVININQNINLGDVYLDLTVYADYIEDNVTLNYINQSIFDINVNLNQSGFPYYTTSQISDSPLLVDLDLDQEMEIIFGDYAGRIHVLNKNGEEVFNDIFPFETGNQIWGAPASADLNLDGYPEVVISSKDKHLYIFDRTGLITSYDASSYLIGTPSIGNFDDDPELEIAVGGYSSSGKKIYVVNYDGSDVIGFPVTINEKIQRGVSVHDIDNNGKDDLVFGTDSNNIYLLLDNGTVAEGFPFEGDNKFRVAPIILEYNNELIIVAASSNGTLYGIDTQGNMLFDYETNYEISTSPSVHIIDSQLYVFFGNSNGDIFAIDTNGNIHEDFPINVGVEIVGSVMFANIDGEDLDEIIIVDINGFMHIINSDLSTFQNTPIEYEFAFASAPLIIDIDQDNDLEILSGTVNSLFIADIKNNSAENNSWSIFRGNFERTGYYEFNNCSSGDMNQDGIINVVDIIGLINIIVDDQFPTNSQLCLGDINEDLIINVQDIISLINIILNN